MHPELSNTRKKKKKKVNFLPLVRNKKGSITDIISIEIKDRHR